jgi:hypothetical protein
VQIVKDVDPKDQPATDDKANSEKSSAPFRQFIPWKLCIPRDPRVSEDK